jgi:hypothetical protein
VSNNPSLKKKNSLLRNVTQASELASSCEHGNEPSGCIKGGKFLDYLNDYQVAKKDFAPWS